MLARGPRIEHPLVVEASIRQGMFIVQTGYAA